MLPCNAKRQYLRTLQVSRYCLLALQVVLVANLLKPDLDIHANRHMICRNLYIDADQSRGQDLAQPVSNF